MAEPTSHEYPLVEKPQTDLWGENFALAVSDIGNGISLLYSIGTWYGDTSVWREKLTLELPDGQLLLGRNYGRNTSGNIVSAALSRYEILEHEKRMRLVWNGPVFSHGFDELISTGFGGGLARKLELDIIFDAIAPIWDMYGDGSADKTQIMGAMHTEQLGYCAGTIAHDGQSFVMADALSCRDHSRGRRDMTPFKAHAWINGRFEGGRGFQLYAAQLYGVDGLALSKATIIEDGRHHDATIEHVDFLTGYDQHKQPQRFVLNSDLGRMTVNVSAGRTSLPVGVVAPFEAHSGSLPRQKHVQIFDETVDLDWDGQKGLGWSERGWSSGLG